MQPGGKFRLVEAMEAVAERARISYCMQLR